MSVVAVDKPQAWRLVEDLHESDARFDGAAELIVCDGFEMVEAIGDLKGSPSEGVRGLVDLGEDTFGLLGGAGALLGGEPERDVVDGLIGRHFDTDRDDP